MHKRILISGSLVAVVLIIVVVMLTGVWAYPFGLDQAETTDSNISSGPQNDGSSVIFGGAGSENAVWAFDGYPEVYS
jgi:amino acid transporter